MQKEQEYPKQSWKRIKLKDYKYIRYMISRQGTRNKSKISRQNTAIGIKTKWYWCKNRETDWWMEENNESKNRFTHFSQFIHDNGNNKKQYRKDDLLINGAGLNV